MNSNINTLGRVIVSGRKGVLLGGRICAVRGVDAYNLGNSSHLRTLLEIGRTELYEKEQADYAVRRERLLGELSALEKGWDRVLQMISAEVEVPKETLRKIHATIEAKNHEMAGLDAEVSKLINMTEHTMNAPVCIRGRAYEGSVIIINTFKYMLSSEVKRVIFKLRDKKVAMVTL